MLHLFLWLASVSLAAASCAAPVNSEAVSSGTRNSNSTDSEVLASPSSELKNRPASRAAGDEARCVQVDVCARNNRDNFSFGQTTASIGAEPSESQEICERQEIHFHRDRLGKEDNMGADAAGHYHIGKIQSLANYALTGPQPAGQKHGTVTFSALGWTHSRTEVVVRSDNPSPTAVVGCVFD